MSQRGLAANASLALVGDAVAKGGMFAALLVLARLLPVGEFARLGVAMAMMLILTTLLDGGVGIVATREGAANPAVRLGLLHSGTAARMPLLALTSLGCLVAGLVLDQTALALSVLVAAAANAAQQTLFATFRSAQDLLAEAVAKAFCGISYPVLCAAAAFGGHRTAAAAMLAMTIGPLLTLPPLYIRARRTARPEGAAIRPLPLLRRAAPFGLIALATLLYYRSPILLMGAISTHQQTASYTLAANVAFGLLMVPAAIATGLLPRLAGEPDPAVRTRLVRRALRWGFAILAAASLLIAATAWALVPQMFGDAYRSALVPLLILLASGLAIGAAGIFGTALIALDRRREVVGQVLAALAINLVAGVLLIPALAADGAALATLVTELVSLAFLAYTYARFTAVGPAQPARRQKAVLAR
jgi:O-antigen/teichoic acid export membrane protein